MSRIIPWKKKSDQALARREDEHPFDRLHREMNELFESFFDDEPRPFGMTRWPMERKSFSIEPSFEVSETDDAVQVAAELPGMDEKDIEITLDRRTLIISGEKKEEHEEKKKNTVFSERRYGSFQRMLTVPDGIDEAHVKASFKKGILKLELPKKPEARGNVKKIAIKSE